MRRELLAATVVGAAATALAATPALAWNSWCDDEPPVTIVTPGGHHVTVNNWISVPIQDHHLLRSMVVTGDAEPGAEPGTTLVHVHVHTPHGGSQFVKVTSSAGRFREETTGRGAWDSEIVLDLTIPVE